jgi:predicted transcriptional regulator
VSWANANPIMATKLTSIAPIPIPIIFLSIVFSPHKVISMFHKYETIYKDLLKPIFFGFKDMKRGFGGMKLTRNFIYFILLTISMELRNIKLWLPISLLALVVVMSIIGYNVFQNFTNDQTTNGHATCANMIPNYVWWISLILMIIIIVPVSYYTISKRLEEKMEKNLNVITKMVDHRIKSGSKKENSKTNNNGSILKLLNLNEKKVVEKIIENNGSALQSEISRMEGMTKLKVHRAVKELERKGIVKLEQYGKTNRIVLSDDIRDIFSNK